MINPECNPRAEAAGIVLESLGRKIRSDHERARAEVKLLHETYGFDTAWIADRMGVPEGLVQDYLRMTGDTP